MHQNKESHPNPSTLPGGLFTWAALVSLASTLIFLSPIGNLDIWWHLDSGRWMLEHGRFLDHEVRSFSMAGAAWPNFSWLFQVITALVDQCCGGWGLLALKGAGVWAIFFLLFLAIGGRGAPMSWVLSLTLFSWQIVPYLYLRPHLFEGVFLAVAIWFFQRPPPRYGWFWYAALILIWANTHASVVVGAAALSLHLLTGPVFSRPSPRTLLPRLPSALALMLLVVATPNGWGIIDVMLGHAKGASMYFYLNEWKAPAMLPAFIFMALAAILSTAFFRKEVLRPAELLLIIVFFFLGSGSKRFLFELSLVLVRPTGTLIGIVLEYFASRWPRLAGRHGWKYGVVLLLAIALFYPLKLPWKELDLTDYPIATRQYPHVAMAVLNALLKDEPSLKIWNPYGWGGYLGWRSHDRLKVYIDGRTPTVFTEEMMLKTNLSRQRPKMLRSLLAKWNVDAVLLRRIGALPIPPQDPVWRLVAYDDRSVLYLRSDLAKRHNIEGIDFDPFQPTITSSIAAAPRLAIQVKQLLDQDQDNALAWFHLAELLAIEQMVVPSREGPREIITALRNAIDRDPEQLLPRLRLAQWLRRLGAADSAVAAPLLPAVWKVSPAQRSGFEVSIARVLLQAGYPRNALKLLSPPQVLRHQQLDRHFEVWQLRVAAYSLLGDKTRAEKANEVAVWMALDARPRAVGHRRLSGLNPTAS